MANKNRELKLRYEKQISYAKNYTRIIYSRKNIIEMFLPDESWILQAVNDINIERFDFMFDSINRNEIENYLEEKLIIALAKLK